MDNARIVYQVIKLLMVRLPTFQGIHIIHKSTIYIIYMQMYAVMMRHKTLRKKTMAVLTLKVLHMGDHSNSQKGEATLQLSSTRRSHRTIFQVWSLTSILE